MQREIYPVIPFIAIILSSVSTCLERFELKSNSSRIIDFDKNIALAKILNSTSLMQKNPYYNPMIPSLIEYIKISRNLNFREDTQETLSNYLEPGNTIITQKPMELMKVHEIDINSVTLLDIIHNRGIYNSFFSFLERKYLTNDLLCFIDIYYFKKIKTRSVILKKAVIISETYLGYHNNRYLLNLIFQNHDILSKTISIIEKMNHEDMELHNTEIFEDIYIVLEEELSINWKEYVTSLNPSIEQDVNELFNVYSHDKLFQYLRVNDSLKLSFKTYLRQVWSEELFLFWEDVQRYKSKSDSLVWAKIIASRWLGYRSEPKIELNQQDTAQIFEQIESGTVDKSLFSKLDIENKELLTTHWNRYASELRTKLKHHKKTLLSPKPKPRKISLSPKPFKKKLLDF